MKNYKDFLSKNATKNLTMWLKGRKYQEYHQELTQMIEDEKWQDLENAFFKVLEFGTGGRRGTVGVGSNRVNKVTVGESMQGLLAYADNFESNAKQKGVVIACDTRNSSPELTEYAAKVAVAQGFMVYVFDDYRSTPELSYAVRTLGCAVGVVISASHNPPSDNGFKAYWSDGGQLVSPHDKGVMDEVSKVEEILITDYDEAVASGKIKVLSAKMDDDYFKAVLSEGYKTEGNSNLKVVFSPLHGAGQKNTLPVLQKAGFDVDVVEAQMTPDGDFPTVKNYKPNPEEKVANELAVEQMLKTDADIAVTNDPDADRVGVVVNYKDEAVYLNGNQTAVLATEYVLSQMEKNGNLKDNQFIAKTIVTTDMLKAQAENYGVKCYDNLLIGFKYIGELILKKQAVGEKFIIGGEESYGLLKGDYARDKDASVGALMLAEYASKLKADGKTLLHELEDLYEKYGFFAELLDVVMYEGASGFEQMQNIMKSLRETTPKELAGQKVTHVVDYSTLTRKNILTGKEEQIDCVKGNVLVFEFENSSCRLTVRPSGTEPKLKSYTQWKSRELSYPQVEKLMVDVSVAFENYTKLL